MCYVISFDFIIIKSIKSRLLYSRLNKLIIIENVFERRKYILQRRSNLVSFLAGLSIEASMPVENALLTCPVLSHKERPRGTCTDVSGV